MSKKDISVGDLVRWVTSYDDDPDLIKDAGIGIVITEGSASNRFIVYRNKFNDIIDVSEASLRRL